MKVLLQDFVPYDQSVQWLIHDAYFADRGIGAWGDGPIPYASTSNFAIARQHAQMLLALVEELTASGALGRDEPVTLLEVGSGNGDFAVNLLRALEHDFAGQLFERVRYVLSDYSERSIRESIEQPQLASHLEAGRIIPALYDLRRPTELKLLDGAPEPSTVTAVISNYVCCVVPNKVVQKQAGTWSELNARVTVEVEPANELAAASGDPCEVLAWLVSRSGSRDEMHKALAVEYEWFEVELEELFAAPHHAAIISRACQPYDEATLSYPHTYVDFLSSIGERLGGGGAVVVNDYGSAEADAVRGLSEPRPARYGNTLNHAVEFAIFDAFAALASWHAIRTPNPLASIHTALLRPAPPWPRRLERAFHDAYVSRQDGEDLLDFDEVAQHFSELEDHERAARFWERGLRLDPDNIERRYKVGEALIDSGHYARAIHHLERGLTLDPNEQQDFSFALGRAFCLRGEYDRAIEWYERSLAREDHAVTRTNLGILYANRERPDDARDAFLRALELDPSHERARQRLARLDDPAAKEE